MSMLVKADASGAVTLPAELCRAAGVESGADLVAEVQDGRIVLQPASANGQRQPAGEGGNQPADAGRSLSPAADAAADELFREARRLLAARAYEQAIDRLDVHRPPEWAVLDVMGARTLRALGQAYLGLGNLPAARDCLEQLRATRKEQNLLSRADYAAALSDLFKCYRGLGQMEAARACQEETRQLL